MGVNQFRRDPVSGQWSIIVQNEFDIQELIGPEPRSNGSEKKSCILCGGHESETNPELYAVRENTAEKNKAGWAVRVIPNEQPILQIFGDLNNRGVGMYDVLDGIGAHELVIETPEHNKTLHELSFDQIQNVLSAYRERILDLKKDTRFRYVLLHKNHGDGTGPTAQHAFSHIIATPITPGRVKAELMNAMAHYQYKERCLFCDIIYQETTENKRIILQNDRFVAFAPFASRAPFTAWILPLQHETFFEANTDYAQLAQILREVLVRISTTLNNPNFVMVLHSGPNTNAGQERGYWKTIEKDYHWHIAITPRFRGYASFDVGSGFQINVIPPERAAKILRDGKVD